MYLAMCDVCVFMSCLLHVNVLREFNISQVHESDTEQSGVNILSCFGVR